MSLHSGILINVAATNGVYCVVCASVKSLSYLLPQVLPQWHGARLFYKIEVSAIRKCRMFQPDTRTCLCLVVVAILPLCTFSVCHYLFGLGKHYHGCLCYHGGWSSCVPITPMLSAIVCR